MPRIQFLAIEIARNREGFNSDLRQKFGVAATKKDNEQNKEEEVTEKKDEKSGSS